jgi:NTP pyrophosphatase (non-canonical NTP hydrolase)
MMDTNEQIERIQKLQDDITKWSDDTFGKYRSASPMAHHLRKETEELINALTVLEEEGYTHSDISAIGIQDLIQKNKRVLFELADCLTLIMDCASHAQINMNTLINAVEEKLKINKSRTWGKPDVNGVVEHIET